MGKTTLTEKIGYAFASLGDATAYGFIGVFLLFFLTTVAGISPGIAGTIAAIGSVWNAVFNPIMGYFADRVRTRFGRRRPVMLAFSVPLMLVMFLSFTNVDIPMSVKPAYYGLLVMLYWTCFTGFFTPYMALGVDYTSDYDDRTVLRLFGSFFNLLGTVLSMVLPTTLVDMMQGWGASLERAWSLTALLLGVASCVSILITVAVSKDKDPPCEEEGGGERLHLKETAVNIFSEYISVFKLKPMKSLFVASLCSLIGYTMIMSDMVYLFTYNKGLSASEISVCLMARALLALVFIPIVGKMMIHIDRRGTLILCYLFGTIGMLVVRMTAIPDPAGLVVYMIFVTVCTAIYWQIMPGIFYDVCEYDKIMNGKSRSATIVSFQGLVEALAVGIGGQLLGIILEFAGFDGDAAAQTETAQLWIENAGTVIPVAFLLVAAVALYRYPISRAYYNEMMKQGSKYDETRS